LKGYYGFSGNRYLFLEMKRKILCIEIVDFLFCDSLLIQNETMLRAEFLPGKSTSFRGGWLRGARQENQWADE
jgi:hypothetical protein